MKEKTTLKKFMLLPVTACDAIKEELESMALKGWKLKRMGVRYEFEKIEPQRLTYTVDFFPKASVYDTQPSDGTADYIECCRQAGWDLVAVHGTMHIFVSENEDAVPIHTDETIRLKSVEKSMLKTNWATWFAMPIILICDLALLFDFKSFVTSNMNICTVIFCVGLLMLFISDLFCFLYWSVKNQKRVKNGEKIKFVGSKTSKKIFAVRISFVMITVLIVPLLISVVAKNWFCVTLTGLALFSIAFYTFVDALVEKFKVPKSAYIFLAFAAVILVYAVSFFTLLKFDGIFNSNTGKPSDSFSFATGPNYTYNFYYLKKSILASEEEVSVYNDDKYEFRYITFKSNSQFIMKKYYDEYYKTDYRKLPQENDAWNAKEVLISDKGNNLIVVYDNALIHFVGRTDFTDEQKSEVEEKLTKPVDGFLPSLSVNQQK